MARISLILSPGFADWEYAFIAGTASPFYGIDVRFFAPTTGQINSQGGLAVTIDSSLQQCLDWKPWICPYKTGHQLPVKLMQLPSA